MQFIVMLTARSDGLNAADWITNAVGRRGELLVGELEFCVHAHLYSLLYECAI
jgi:hypothetical protein